MDIPIEALNLTVRRYNALKRAGIDTVEDLKGYITTLTDIDGIGEVGAEEILTVARRYLPIGMGANSKCFAYAPPTDKKLAKCKILKGWYNNEIGRECDKCPFFKTHYAAGVQSHERSWEE